MSIVGICCANRSKLEMSEESRRWSENGKFEIKTLIVV